MNDRELLSCDGCGHLFYEAELRQIDVRLEPDNPDTEWGELWLCRRCERTYADPDDLRALAIRIKA